MTFGSSGSRGLAYAAGLAAVTTVLAAGHIATPGAIGDDRGRHGGEAHDAYSVALFGDMPYNALGRAQYPALLADINGDRVAFSVFDGDLKAGGDGPCSDDLDTTAIANFNRLVRPLIWLPGDNDWTDCWGRYGPTSQPYSDPLERLAFERALFAATDQSLGERTLRLTRESSEGGQFAEYAENVRWKYGPVIYIGMNVQGSNDNYPYAGVDGESRPQAEIDRQRAESMGRKAANLHWLHEGFAFATRTGGPRPRRQPLLQDRQADGRPGRRRAGQLHARRDLRSAEHALGAGDDRSGKRESLPFRAAHRRSERAMNG